MNGRNGITEKQKGMIKIEMMGGVMIIGKTSECGK
jgi:hypothetical protein